METFKIGVPSESPQDLPGSCSASTPSATAGAHVRMSRSMTYSAAVAQNSSERSTTVTGLLRRSTACLSAVSFHLCSM